MPTSSELNINTTVDATDLANELFGSGVSVVRATISGADVRWGGRGVTGMRNNRRGVKDRRSGEGSRRYLHGDLPQPRRCGGR